MARRTSSGWHWALTQLFHLPITLILILLPYGVAKGTGQEGLELAAILLCTYPVLAGVMYFLFWKPDCNC